MDINTVPFMMVMAGLSALAATVLLVIFVLPEKKRTKFGKIGALLHDIFNFKFLIVEKILQVLYILSTCSCIFTGLFLLFSFTRYDFGRYDYSHWYGLEGLVILLLGPIVIRLVYELMMMGLLLVKNVIQINNKLKGDDTSPFSIPSVKSILPDQPKAPTYVQPPVYGQPPYVPPTAPVAPPAPPAPPVPHQ